MSNIGEKLIIKFLQDYLKSYKRKGKLKKSSELNHQLNKFNIWNRLLGSIAVNGSTECVSIYAWMVGYIYYASNKYDHYGGERLRIFQDTKLKITGRVMGCHGG